MCYNIISGNYENVKLLIDHGANIDVINDKIIDVSIYDKIIDVSIYDIINGNSPNKYAITTKILTSIGKKYDNDVYSDFAKFETKI